MAAWFTAARQPTYLNRLFSLTPPSLIHRRGFASAAEQHGLHGSQKVNFWQDPLHPSRWKEEHFVIVSLAGWGGAIYCGYKLLTGDEQQKKDEKVGEAVNEVNVEKGG